MFAGFMVNTWIAATMVALVAGVVGFFVVLRRAAFAAHVLPLGGFPGAAAASLLGLNELYGLGVFCALGVVAISQLQRWERRDVATALWLAGSLALGTLFLSMTRQYAQGVYGLLFGEVLGVGRSQIALLAVLSAIALAATALLARALLLDSIASELGTAAGSSSRALELAFLAVLALSTAMALPVVGALMVFSLMVGPACAARAFTDRPLSALALSAAIALVTVWIGIALAYLTDWPVGFFVGTFGAFSYGAGWVRGRSSGAGTVTSRGRTRDG